MLILKMAKGEAHMECEHSISSFCSEQGGHLLQKFTSYLKMARNKKEKSQCCIRVCNLGENKPPCISASPQRSEVLGAGRLNF